MIIAVKNSKVKHYTNMWVPGGIPGPLCITKSLTEDSEKSAYQMYFNI